MPVPTWNTAAFLILAMMAVNAVLDLGVAGLNLRTFKRPLPDEFADVFDAKAYDQSQRYTLSRTLFSLIHTAFFLLVTVGFWWAGGFGALDTWLRGWGWSPLWTGMAFLGCLSLGQLIVGLPFSLYSTFVIEERFGFNRTTALTFLLDLLKGLLLTLVLGGLMLLAVQSLFLYAGDRAWLYAWSAMVALTTTLAFIAPTWIMPLFSKFTPLEDGPLKQAIDRLAAEQKFPHGGVFVMDGSRRSTKSNAYFTGFGSKKRIVLFDTLIAHHTVPELTAVLAHEIGHYQKKHILWSLAAGAVQFGWTFFLFQWCLRQPAVFDAFGVQPSIYAGLAIFLLALSLLNTGWSVGMNALARAHEYQADRFAAEATRNPEAMVTALKRLSRDNLSNLQPHPWYVFFHHNHPTALERIAALRRLSIAA